MALQYAERAIALDAGVAVLGGEAQVPRQRTDIQFFYFGDGVTGNEVVA